MLRKKKRARGVKEKKVRKKCLDERESLSYEQQILDNNRLLSQLRSRNEELEIELKILNKKYEKLQEDGADIVAHLKRDLEEKTDETQELSERLTAMEELRKEELKEYKKKEKTMEFEYRTMETNLSTELKLAAGKLGALEDWRTARLDLMRKFELQEEEIARQNELHKTRLYEAEKSVIIAKATMQEEMGERLKRLAEDFQKATNMRVADVMHTAVRRNIALNRELNSLLKVYQDVETETAEIKDNDRVLRLENQLYEIEAKIAQKDVTSNRDAMHKFAQRHVEMYRRCGQMLRENRRFDNYEQRIKHYEALCVQMQEREKILEREVEDVKKDKEHILAEVQVKYEELDRVNKLLGEARQRVLEMLQLQEHVCTRDICSECSVFERQKIIHSLEDILEALPEEHSVSDTIEDDSQERKADL